MAAQPGTLRVFASKPFQRFARRFGISDSELWRAAFRKAARVYLNYSEEEMNEIVPDKALSEIFKPIEAVRGSHG